METWVLLIALLLVFLTLQYLKQCWDHRRYPPGPFPLPIIGSMWRIGTGVYHDTFRKMAKRYGNIYTLQLGPLCLVVISGFKTVKEALVNRSEDFSERPVTPFYLGLQEGKSIALGIVFSNGHTWKQQRRFAVIAMRKLGLGKKGLELQIEQEAEQLVEIFERKKGQPFDPSQLITNSISNVICALVFGHRFDSEDENFQKLMEIIDKTLKFVGSNFHLLYERFPWLMKHLPGPHQGIISSVKILHSFIKKVIEEHKEQNLMHDPQDFIDFYLLQMQKMEKKNDRNSTYDEDNLSNCIFDLFITGTETTTTALRWALLHLANYPDVQEKVHREIEDVVGSSKIIHYQDHKKMPYTNAVIHEIHRSNYGVIAGVPRQCTKNVTVSGFLLPKGTIVLPDLHSVLLDPERWETPEQFNPNHFLDKEGHFVPREEFMPFGAGARICLGEQLARIELFIFLTNLLRAFHFQPPDGVKLNQKPGPGLTSHPHPYKICAIPY